jgi:hypothetical protein
MSRAFKLLVAASFTWAIFVLGVVQFAKAPNGWTWEYVELLLIIWAIPSVIVLAIGAVFRWALV